MTRSTVRGSIMLLAFLLAFLLSSPPAAASPGRAELVGGFQGNAQAGYGFATFLPPSGDAALAPVVRMNISYLYYRYRTSTGYVLVDSPGEALGLGLRWQGAGASAQAGVGYEARYSIRRGSDGTVEGRLVHGPSLDAGVYLQAAPRLGIGAGAWYGLAERYAWSRVMTTWRIAPVRGITPHTLGAGLEAIGHGNAEAFTLGGGVFGELGLPGTGTTLTAGVGVARMLGPEEGPHLGALLRLSAHRAF